MRRRPPGSTRTDTRFPDTALVRSASSEVPPHTPESWLVARAYSRHGAWASHSRHTALAFSICSMAGPVVPTGKKRSGSVSRQDATRSEEHTYELQSLMRISYAVFCLNTKKEEIQI